MSVKENSGRGTREWGGADSYGNHAWDGGYNHVSFLSEMVPVSFHDCRGGKAVGYSGLTDEMLMKGITPFPVVRTDFGGLACASPSMVKVGTGVRVHG